MTPDPPSRLKIMWREQIFEYFIFALSIVQKPAKIVIFAIFGTLSLTCYKKPKKRKFKNVLSSSFLHPLCANFKVIWSNCQGGIAFSRLLFFKSWSKRYIFVPFLNIITLLLLDCLTIENFLKICTKILHKSAKTFMEQIF